MGIRWALMIFLAAAFMSSTLVWLPVRSGMNCAPAWSDQSAHRSAHQSDAPAW